MNQTQEPDRLEGILPKRVRNFHRRIWNKQEDQCLQTAVAQFGTRNWKAITASMEGRSLQQCIQRWKSLKPNPGNRKEWMATEDNKLYELYLQLGPDWNKIQQQLSSRTAQQIRKRYINHVDPKLIKTPWTPEEDKKIVETYLELGPIWTHLSSQMEGRSENMIKNRFHSYLRNNYVIPMKEIPKPQSACFRTRIPKIKTELEAPPIEKHLIQSEQIPIQPQQPDPPALNMQLISQQLQNVFQDSVSKNCLQLVHNRILELQFYYIKCRIPAVNQTDCIISVTPFQNIINGQILGIPVMSVNRNFQQKNSIQIKIEEGCQVKIES